MQGWRHTAKTIVATFLVTSAAWLIGGAVLFERWRSESRPAEPLDAAAAAAPRPAPANQAPAAQPSLAAAVVAPSGARGLMIPVQGVRREELIDTFTQSRGGGQRVHNAIDIMAARGTFVVAAAPGTVEKLFVSVRGGNTVYVRSPDRTLIYYYAHLDAYAPGLTAGQAVRPGDRLGTVGITGNARQGGPHLHFEVQQTSPESGWWQPTVSLNPYPLLTGR